MKSSGIMWLLMFCLLFIFSCSLFDETVKQVPVSNITSLNANVSGGLGVQNKVLLTTVSVCSWASGKEVCEEKYRVYAVGKYYNCSIKTNDNEVYKNFSAEGQITNKINYLVSMNDIFDISNKTLKPIVCGIQDSNREKELGDGVLSEYSHYVSPSEMDGQYCSGTILFEDGYLRYDDYKIYCCVDEYCAVYNNHVQAKVICSCDDSLNVTNPIEYICSNTKDGVPKCQ